MNGGPRARDVASPAALADPHHRVERVALAAGIILAATSLIVLALLALTEPAIARGLALQWAAHTAIGKETSVPTGLASGVPPPVVVLAVWAQDAVVLLIGYPVAAMVARGTLKWAWLEKRIHKPHPKHAEFARRTETVGIALLAASLWLPFLPSGGLVAALLGRAAGYRPLLFLPILAGSALCASIAYTALYVYAFDRIADQRIVFGAAIVITIVSLAVGWWYHRREKRRASAST